MYNCIIYVIKMKEKSELMTFVLEYSHISDFLFLTTILDAILDFSALQHFWTKLIFISQSTEPTEHFGMQTPLFMIGDRSSGLNLYMFALLYVHVFNLLLFMVVYIYYQ